MSTKLKANPQQRGQLIVLDETTGGVTPIDHVEVAVVAFQNRPKFKEGFLMVFLKGLEELAKAGLVGFDYKVLLLMMSRCDYENWIICSPSGFARELHAAPQAVSRAIRHLRDQGCIEVRTVSGTTKAYRLCSSFGWRGKVASFTRTRTQELTEGLEPLQHLV